MDALEETYVEHLEEVTYTRVAGVGMSIMQAKTPTRSVVHAFVVACAKRACVF